jgi:GNAT superfamily N-acetyltransferase
MSVLLTNLVARTPNLEDMYSITELVTACDIAEHGIADSTPGMSPHLSSRWQHSGFHLETDAWVIVAGKRRFVGFGCVWHRDFEEFYTYICVHPDYRKRGIGTLLLRLVEDRARQLMRNAQPGARVSLKGVISAKNAQARSLFEREGYSLIREFWSVTMAMVESQDGRSHAGTITFDVDVEENRLVGAEQLFDREGVYSIRQFCAYEKELRPLLTMDVADRDESGECDECDEREGGGALVCAQE